MSRKIIQLRIGALVAQLARAWDFYKGFHPLERNPKVAGSTPA